MKIVLIGFMCSGKSAVGRVCAERLKWPHFDTDEMIVKQVGASIADIINKQGEEAFREIERKVVALVAMIDKCVISTGGGMPLNPANMKDLSQNGLVVWLKVSPETVLKRAGNLKSRPLIDSQDPLGSLTQRLKSRAAAYGEAPTVIETDHASVPDIAARILTLLPGAAI